ncbi:neo-calmodulin-like isoform X2 [Mizuhopecten yessoensis]|uniref:neo-calmodulin-like isoform X2 n=1 Tax=Mizuhopecten yessoensis TaxID=6573 RepID=UPI000B45C34F|nr:neo-calmodulin-like isoform X2 [Mizuhopecten yessoensis]
MSSIFMIDYCCFDQSGNITDEIREEIKESFEMFDSDHDGKISTSEIKNLLTNLGMTPDKSVIDDVIKRLDADENGTVEYDEFEDFITKSGFLKCLPDETDQEMLAAFQVLDADGDGFITKDELIDFMSRFGDKKTESEIMDMIKEADVNKDGRISYTEFTKHMAPNL